MQQTTIDCLIADLWQRFPAKHRLNLTLQNQPVVIYSNASNCLHQLGCYFCDDISMVGNARLLITVLDVDPITDEGRDTLALVHTLGAGVSFNQGCGRYDGARKLAFIDADPRHLVVGDCTSSPHLVTDFIEASAAAYPESLSLPT